MHDYQHKTQTSVQLPVLQSVTSASACAALWCVVASVVVTAVTQVAIRHVASVLGLLAASHALSVMMVPAGDRHFTTRC